MLKEKDGSYKMNLGIGFKDGKSIEFMPEEQHDILCLIKKELNCFLSPFLGKLARLTYDLVDDTNIRLYKTDGLGDLSKIDASNISIYTGSIKTLTSESDFDEEQEVYLVCRPASGFIDFGPIECEVLLTRAAK